MTLTRKRSQHRRGVRVYFDVNAGMITTRDIANARLSIAKSNAAPARPAPQQSIVKESPAPASYPSGPVGAFGC